MPNMCKCPARVLYLRPVHRQSSGAVALGRYHCPEVEKEKLPSKMSGPKDVIIGIESGVPRKIGSLVLIYLDRKISHRRSARLGQQRGTTSSEFSDIPTAGALAQDLLAFKLKQAIISLIQKLSDGDSSWVPRFCLQFKLGIRLSSN